MKDKNFNQLKGVQGFQNVPLSDRSENAASITDPGHRWLRKSVGTRSSAIHERSAVASRWNLRLRRCARLFRFEAMNGLVSPRCLTVSSRFRTDRSDL
ncbi:hypothetical protein [Paramicrobacterium agarici]